MKRWFLIAVIGFGILLLVGIVVVLIAAESVPTDDPVSLKTPNETLTNENALTFPGVVGTNLLFEEIRVPLDLASGLKLIVVSYDSAQQPDVDKWLTPLEILNETYPELSGYYIPMLPKEASDGAAFIIGGMALAAQNDEDRIRTIVVFTNVDGFNKLVNVPDKNAIQLFLVDAENRILWQGTGEFAQEKIDSLQAVLTSLEQ